MNVVFILSDQHNSRFAGCYGHPFAQTPHIDRIAKNGTRFTQAWCNSPLCVPSRASLFTGRYVFEHACWDNCIAWDGRLKGWPDAFRQAGVQLTTIGKLDFASGEHGIENELLGTRRDSRDTHSLYRSDPSLPPRWQEYSHQMQSGPKPGLTLEKMGGWEAAERACAWLQNERPADRPWVLNINFLEPHPAWPCPPEMWDKWKNRVKLSDLPPIYFEDPARLHPFNRNYAHHSTGLYNTPEEVLQSYIAYLVHCEMVDALVGKVVTHLARLNLLHDTLLIYTSDHGESCHAHQQWGKMNMYEEALRVPLCVQGPGIPAGRVETAPVSLIDIFPTCCAAAGAPLPDHMRGISLLPLLRQEKNAPRNDVIFSEYHANGALAGMFALTDGRWKYVEYVGARSMLFDLSQDRDELHDLAVAQPNDPAIRSVIARMRQHLYHLCSPQAVDLHAKNDQAGLRREMERDGTLALENHKRGYERRADTLVPRPEMIPAHLRGKI